MILTTCIDHGKSTIFSYRNYHQTWDQPGRFSVVMLVYRSVVDEIQVLLGRGGITSHLDLTEFMDSFLPPGKK